MAPNVDLNSLPQNTDLKMLDGDVVQYAAQLCHYDLKPQFQPKRCDVFVQADKVGVLLGYVTITQDDKGAWLDSDITLNDPQSRGKSGVGTQNGPRYTLRFCRAFDGAHLAKRSERGGWRIGIGPEVIAGEIDMLPTER